MKKLLLLLPLLMMVGCCSTPEAESTERFRGVLGVVKQRDIKYTAADPTLSDKQKADVVDYWDSMESWTKDREEALKK